MARRETELLLACVLPQPLPSATPWSRLDWPAFWATFDACAPLHLRWGLVAATWIVARCYLRVRLGRGWRAALARAAGAPTVADHGAVGAAALDAALDDAGRSAVLAPLIDVLKVVAALACFDDAATDAAYRVVP